MLARYLPVIDWLKVYNKHNFSSDLLAALIVTIMLIPQSLAYAMLAGLPPEVGLYASILPLVAYTLFGTSRTLSVGPVAVISLMTAASISQLNVTDSSQYLAAAVMLALMSGLMLVLMGIFKLGILANFLSHPVISGFITASGILIAASQLPHILGISAKGHNLLELLLAIARELPHTNLLTLGLGGFALGFLFWSRSGLKPLLISFGISEHSAGLLAKAGPVLAIFATTLTVWAADLVSRKVSIVGAIPAGLPQFGLPSFDAWLFADGM